LDLSLTDTSPSRKYTLSLHDALPIYKDKPAYPLPLSSDDDGNIYHVGSLDAAAIGLTKREAFCLQNNTPDTGDEYQNNTPDTGRSEEHTSELQSREKVVCRLLLEKKK